MTGYQFLVHCLSEQMVMVEAAQPATDERGRRPVFRYASEPFIFGRDVSEEDGE